jgi:hypothetical protein
MDAERSKSMYHWRPRLSLLSALLLMTIVGLSIAVTQLWREVGPLRAKVSLLRNETGRLSVDDPTQIHAIEVRTSEPLLWKWRVWVPDGRTGRYFLLFANISAALASLQTAAKMTIAPNTTPDPRHLTQA